MLADNIKCLIKESMNKWKTKLYADGKLLGYVKIWKRELGVSECAVQLQRRKKVRWEGIKFPNREETDKADSEC